MEQGQQLSLSDCSIGTVRALQYEAVRAAARHNYSQDDIVPPSTSLHLGCGSRLIAGWLNVDVAASDFDLDLICNKPLPWRESSFTRVASQHFIEHLDLQGELLPLLERLHRVCSAGCVLWFSCPDMGKICQAYLRDRCLSLLEGRQRRFPSYNLGGMPPQQMLNELFHQSGEHKNLFDFDLLRWTLERAGYTHVQLGDETAFLREMPEFPPRYDDEVSLYVRCVRL